MFLFCKLFSLTCYCCFQGQGSTCWKPQLTPLWSCQLTRPPCTTLRIHTKTHHLQTRREFPSAPLDPLKKHFKEYVETRVCLFSRCPSILGELLPAQGHYYWETIVSGSTAYRLGVAYSSANRNSSLGENSQSWCLQCVPTPSGYA